MCERTKRYLRSRAEEENRREKWVSSGATGAPLVCGVRGDPPSPFPASVGTGARFRSVLPSLPCFLSASSSRSS